jgi:hypothetical protein
MKKVFVMVALATTFCASCAKEVSNADTTKPQDYMAAFSFANVDDLTWSPDDGCFTVEYSDPDAFDPQPFYDLTGRDIYYWGHLTVDIDDELVPEFVYDWRDWQDGDTHLDNKYSISVHFLQFDDGTIDVLFEVVLDGWED